MPLQKLEEFIDHRLQAMFECPRLWGSPEALEGECLLLVELFERFCSRRGAVNPQRSYFERFAQEQLPQRPGPMPLAQWFTDPEWGCKEAKKASDPKGHEHQHWAGQQIVGFFIAWKRDLKSAST